ncbi:MAG: DUF892 family protein [Imperialibacter sp.]|uniref:YciE/YciF ferroxidase family protein n=1 Tax=Imperialibacter sp. TaxID=2038411 RepID=UPI0032EF3FA2
MRKPKITDLKDALSYQVNQLYVAEKQLKKELTDCVSKVASKEMKAELTKYTSLAEDKVLKLERVFNYLMEEPSANSNKVIDKMVDETHQLISRALSDNIRDVVIMACLRSIIHYKIARYQIASTFALELEMEVVADLIDEIVDWEKQAELRLESMSVGHLNVKAK